MRRRTIGCLITGAGVALLCALALSASACVILSPRSRRGAEALTPRPLRGPIRHVIWRARGQHTVSDRMVTYGPRHRPEWRRRFERAGLTYPPPRLKLVGLKRERRLQIYAPGEAGQWVHVHTAPIQKLSGGPGPKLARGDRQVPEGLYRIDFLNPNSSNHLSMRVSYPSRRDRARAQEDGREDLGGEIYIHGKRTSIGCLAMGDAFIEQLFVLVGDVGAGHVEVLLSPVDLRRRRAPRVPGGPDWLPERYARIGRALEELPAP